jgi:hypothetical protein
LLPYLLLLPACGVVALVVAFPIVQSIGYTITFKYVVTGNDRFDNLDVSDDKCSPVDPVLAGDGYNVGDLYGTKGVFNGLAGDAWEYTCETTAPAAGAGVKRTNIATVTGTSPWPVWAALNPFTDTDTLTLQSAVLRKQVALYLRFPPQVILAPNTGAEVFGVDVLLDTGSGFVDVGDEVVSGNTPLTVWLSPGTWKLDEKTPPPPNGYVAATGRTTFNIGAVPKATGAGMDLTIFNIAPFDLAIEKTGPDFAYGGAQVTYGYSVTNTGTGIVTPVVTDDLCGTPTYTSGDTTAPIGKINPGEIWTYTCTYTPDWDAAFPDPLTNTATVSDVEFPEAWTPLFGGDTNTANNTDTYTLYPFVLRKDVGLYNDGNYPDFGAFADNTTFPVKAYLSGAQKTTFTISENSPKTMWLAAGTWTFQEYNLPTGYFAFYPNATITFVTGTYPDWTHLNVTWSGCSHGYWKNNTPWPSGYAPTDTVGTYFTGSGFSASTLADALAFGGGSGVSGAEQILLRQAVAALLNEAQYGGAFGPYGSVDALKTAVSAALASDNRGTMLNLAGTLDYWNNGVCRH